MKKVDFNKGWLLQKNGSAKTQEVNLPHDAMLAEERNKDVLTGGASAYFSRRSGQQTWSSDIGCR